MGGGGRGPLSQALRGVWREGWGLVPEVLMRGESCNARSPLVSSVLSLTVNNLT